MKSFSSALSGAGESLVDWRAVQVGFVTQLLWPRYGSFWLGLVKGASAEVRFAERERAAALLSEARVQAVPGRALRLAVAQALALHSCDVIVAPELNLGADPGGEVARGGGQDPWIASFPEALAASIAGLPPVLGVPASLGPDLERRAVEVLAQLGLEPAAVRRVWERWRTSARSPRLPEPRWQRRAGERETVGLIGQPWLVGAVAPALAREGVHLLAQHQLEPQGLREEGWRLEPRLIATDAEVLGAARHFGRRAAVDRLELLVDPSSGADLWLARRVRRLVHKPLAVRSLDEVLPDPLALWFVP